MRRWEPASPEQSGTVSTWGFPSTCDVAPWSAIRVRCRAGDTAVVWTLSTPEERSCRSHPIASLTAPSDSAACSPPPGSIPYDEVVWERRDARITNWIDGSVAFEQLGVEFPITWSQNATNIVDAEVLPGHARHARSVSRRCKQVVDRIVDTITDWGIADGYFADDEAEAFRDELKYILVTPAGGVQQPGVVQHRRARACRSRRAPVSSSPSRTRCTSILNWYREEGIIFKGGSGAGVNLSRIRSSFEPLEGGGTASGPVSFMRGADASAGTIKSGGKTRRAAKMVILDADHPDIEQFVWAKAKEERKARALSDAGFDMGLDGADSFSVQYQNANNSVRVTDEFMQAVVDDADWELRAVTTGEVLRTVPARELWREIAQAAWECADPGPAVRHHDQPLAHRPEPRSDHRQ